MTEIDALIIEELENFNSGIRDALQVKGINTTGEAANSLRVELTNKGGRSLGVFYLEFLDTGRGPGKPPPFRKILEWAANKTGRPIAEVYGLAKYVTDKIAAEGTRIFRDNGKGIELTRRRIEVTEQLRAKLPPLVKLEVKQYLNRYKKLYRQKLTI